MDGLLVPLMLFIYPVWGAFGLLSFHDRSLANIWKRTCNVPLKICLHFQGTYFDNCYVPQLCQLKTNYNLLFFLRRSFTFEIKNSQGFGLRELIFEYASQKVLILSKLILFEEFRVKIECTRSWIILSVIFPLSILQIQTGDNYMLVAFF